MNVYLVIYAKDKSIKVRFIRNGRNLKVGNFNSYSWEIIDLQILYVNCFILLPTYENIRLLETKKRNLKKKKIEKIKKIISLLHDTFS